MLNSLAALLSSTLAGAEPERIAAGLSGFSGVRRRFEFKGLVEDGPFAGTRVYDDYAHHPTEVTAVLTAAREKVESEGKGARVVVCFQPHLYSRTQNFAQEFADALSLADVVMVLDIFGAREAPVEDVTSRLITDKMDSSVPVVLEPNFLAVPVTLASMVRPGDVILTMGAGSVTMLADEILAQLRQAEV